MAQHTAEPDYEKEFAEYLAREKHLGLMVHERAKKYGDSKIAVRHKVYGEWEAFTWKQFVDIIDNTAKGLLEWGVKEEDFVGIFAANRVEWAACDFASFSIRAASVPVYATNSAAELLYIVNHAEIRILFVGDQVQYEKAMSIRQDAPTLQKIVVFDRTIQVEKSDSVWTYDDFMAMGAKSKQDSELKRRLSEADAEDLSTLIYTSGTTGNPKGVMLTHKNWFVMLFSTGYHIPIIPTDVNLAFLPLTHVFERAWSYYILTSDAQVDYCHDTKALNTFLVESRPHYMCSVPRLWEKIYATVNDQISNSSPMKQKIFKWAFEVGGEYEFSKRDGKPISGWLEFKHNLAVKLVLHKIRDLFGGRTKVYNCGGSAFSGEISEFFYRAGVLLLQGYGMTECFVICVSTPERNKFGTCGPVVPLMDVRISPEGEIQAKSPAMMKGYYKDPQLTAEVLTEDGYMKTGDVGFIDDQGYINITDRIKDLFKTSGGKYVAPQQIETLLKDDFYIESVAAVGDGRKYVSALIVPSFEALENYARKNNIPFNSRQELVKNPKIIDFYRQRINERTVDLGQVEKIKKFTLLPNEFSQETGELTATQKIKRKVVNQMYADVIDAMYVD